MVGMVIDPVPAMFEKIDPDSDPKKALATIDTFAGPPRYLPKPALARSIKNCPAPVAISTPAKTRKPSTISATILVVMPINPSVRKTCASIMRSNV